MADIQITVNNGAFAITLDQWEWQSLTVNGNPVPKQSGKVQFQSTPTAGPVHFVATADHNIVVQNAGNTLYLQSADQKKTAVAMISYAATPQQVTLTGLLTEFGVVFPGSQAGPLTFSQGKMTGTFKRS